MNPDQTLEQERVLEKRLNQLTKYLRAAQHQLNRVAAENYGMEERIQEIEENMLPSAQCAPLEESWRLIELMLQY